MHEIQHEVDRSGRAPAGYVLLYRPGYSNFCPGCSGSHWHIGRRTAECAYCATALPISATVMPALHDEVTQTGWRALLPAT